MSKLTPPPMGDDLGDDEALLRQARSKLSGPKRPANHWAALAAAAFFALCAIGFAVAAILAPPLSRTPAAKTGVR